MPMFGEGFDVADPVQPAAVAAVDEHERFTFPEDAPLHESAIGERGGAVLGECVESIDIVAGFGVVHWAWGKVGDGAMQLRSVAGATKWTNVDKRRSQWSGSSVSRNVLPSWDCGS